MSMTDDELKSLLAGTTPGAWRVMQERPGSPDVILSDSGEAVLEATWDREDYARPDARDSDLALMAAAPELAAEVLRLREELAEMKLRLEGAEMDAIHGEDI